MKNLIIGFILFQMFMIGWTRQDGVLNPIDGYMVYVKRFKISEPEVVEYSLTSNMGNKTEFKLDLKPENRHSIKVVPYSNVSGNGAPIIDMDDIKVRPQQGFTIE